MHICIGKLVHQWFRWWLVAFLAPSPYLNQCWLLVNPIPRNNLSAIFKQITMIFIQKTLHWRHNGHDGISNHQPYDCLLNRLFRHRSKKTSKLRVTGLCEGIHRGPLNSPHNCPVMRKIFPFDDVIMIYVKISSEKCQPYCFRLNTLHPLVLHLCVS